MHISYAFPPTKAPFRRDGVEILREPLLLEERRDLGSPDAGQLHGASVLNRRKQSLPRGVGAQKLLRLCLARTLDLGLKK